MCGGGGGGGGRLWSSDEGGWGRLRTTRTVMQLGMCCITAHTHTHTYPVPVMQTPAIIIIMPVHWAYVYSTVAVYNLVTAIIVCKCCIP